MKPGLTAIPPLIRTKSSELVQPKETNMKKKTTKFKKKLKLRNHDGFCLPKR